MSAPGGNQLPIGSVYGRTATQTPAWGGPNLRYGDVNPGVNAGYAGQAMPGTPASYQQAFSAIAGTPMSSNPNQYGRWNWAAQMPQQGQPPGQPQQPQPQQPPPQQPYQPPPQQPYQPPPQQPQQPAPQQPQPQAPNNPNGQYGSMPTPTNPYAGGGGNTAYSADAIRYGMNVGDIWSNPVFANMMAARVAAGLGGQPIGA